jgi:glutaredoxin
MNEAALRLVVVGAIAAVALVVVWLLRRRAQRTGSPVDVTDLVTGRAAVVFTKDDCRTCVRTLERLRSLEIPVVQIRAEEHPGELASRAITGVPVTVIVDEDGASRGQFRGLPPVRSLRRAVGRAS